MIQPTDLLIAILLFQTGTWPGKSGLCRSPQLSRPATTPGVLAAVEKNQSSLLEIVLHLIRSFSIYQTFAAALFR
jgi:hypothetical protein